MTKKNKDLITVEISTGWISNDSRKALLDVIRKHPGDSELRLCLNSPGTGLRIQFRSVKYGVAITDAFISDLEAIGVRVFPKGLLPSLA